MLPVEAQSWLSTHQVVETSELRSTQGDVWRVTLEDGARVVVKQGSRTTIDRECWGLKVAKAVGSIPALLSRPIPTVVVLSWHEGTPSTEPEAFGSAGAWLRALHGCEGSFDDPLSVSDAIERRRDAWLKRAQELLSEQTRHRLRSAIDPSAFTGQPRTACHRDFTSSNWLWDGELTVIDFGQARADLSLWDLVKLEAETFHDAPALRRAFFEGYGPLGPRDEERLSQLVLLHGLQTAVWGDLHGDAAFSELGRSILDRRL